MRVISGIILLALLAGCTSPREIADEAAGDVATDLGKLISDVDFTDLHVRDESVCGYADGQKFYSMVAGGSRLSTLVDQDMPEAAKDIVQDAFVACMNKGERV